MYLPQSVDHRIDFGKIIPEIPESKSKKKPARLFVLRNAAAISLTHLKKKSNFMNYGTVKQSLTVQFKVIFRKTCVATLLHRVFQFFIFYFPQIY